MSVLIFMATITTIALFWPKADGGGVRVPAGVHPIDTMFMIVLAGLLSIIGAILFAGLF